MSDWNYPDWKEQVGEYRDWEVIVTFTETYWSGYPTLRQRFDDYQTALDFYDHFANADRMVTKVSLIERNVTRNRLFEKGEL